MAKKTAAQTAQRLRDNFRKRYALRQNVNGTMMAVDQPHGVVNTYNTWGCRCEPCRDAVSVAGRIRRGTYVEDL